MIVDSAQPQTSLSLSEDTKKTVFLGEEGDAGAELVVEC